MARKKRLLVPRLSRTEAQQTYCSECEAMPGQPCVYVAGVRLTGRVSKSADTDALIARIGQPTKVPHNVRVRHPSVRLQYWLADHGHILLLQENTNDNDVHAHRKNRAVSASRWLSPLRPPG